MNTSSLNVGHANVTSLVERKSRYTVLIKNPSRQSRPIMDKIIRAFSPLPAFARQSFTFDCGTEFAGFRALEEGICARSWFCDPRDTSSRLSEDRTDPYAAQSRAITCARGRQSRSTLPARGASMVRRFTTPPPICNRRHGHRTSFHARPPAQASFADCWHDCPRCDRAHRLRVGKRPRVLRA